MAQNAPLQSSSHAAVEGTVVNVDGEPVGDASVQIEGKSAQHPVETKTDAAGVFAFAGLPTGTYTVSAEKSGLHSRVTPSFELPDGARKHLDLVLEPTKDPASASSQAMDFSDTPNFTVAGVTDWTAVGGHGSDATLRTSESLTRETLTLKPQGAESNAIGGGTTESEAKLRAALAASPESFAVNHQLGEFYLRTRRYLQALPLLEAAYRIDPANGGNERDLAETYNGTGDFKQAREHVQKLLARENSADLHRLAGELDEKLSDPLAAVKEDEQAVRLDPSEQNYFAWGSELLLHRAVWQAVEVFTNGAKAYPTSTRMQTGLGTALFAGDRYDEAAQHLCEASDLSPEDPEPYVFMSKIEMAAPTPLSCVEPRLARFVQGKPDSSVANYLYAMAIAKRQGPSPDRQTSQQVEALLTKATTLDPKCFDGFLQLGVLYASQHNYEKAIPLYSRAIDINPQLGEAHYRLGVAYDRLGQREKAQQEFQLHDEIEKAQAAAVERERRNIKQFQVVMGQPAAPVAQ